ncbi:MAG TPA: hypothetical protein VG796_03420 [Verrucomicrobiales bacterium]|jgi:hypothetical protein|nr:hypothetical protein [Verrucomicrobiales bacterium]
MKTRSSLIRLAVLVSAFSGSVTAQTNWEAFNDHRAGVMTDANTTTYEMRLTHPGGPLKNTATGADLAATFSVEEPGGVSDDFGANGDPNPGSPANVLFANKVTIGGAGADGIIGLKSSLACTVILRFSNLDPTKRYKFRGTTCRGNAAYVDRWSVYKIVGVDAATNAHVDGSTNLNIFTVATFPDSALEPDDVALNSGNNLEGSLVGWDNISVGADGTFTIEQRQYLGPAPFGSPSAGPYGYGMNAIYLAELEPTTGGVGTITKVSSANNQITIEWTGPGVLQSNENLTVPWADLLTATSPYTTQMTGSRKFFRLRE